MAATTEEGRLVEAARAGDQRAFGQLFDRWFDRVHDLSRRIVHDDGIAGEVAQDAFLKAWTRLDSLQDPDAFGGWLLRIARNGSLNRLEKERRAVTLDDEAMSAVQDARTPDHDPLEELDQAARIALVWDAAAALGERDASVLDLHLRHGLSAAELADELGVTPNNAHQILFTMRKRLGGAVRAIVLWRAGHPTCADLRQGLSAAGLTSFGAPMVKAIDRHVDACPECSADRTERVSPAALFAAAPIVAASVLIKSSAAGALASAGVPMAGSAALGAAGAAAGAAGAGGAGAGGAGASGSVAGAAGPGAPAGAAGAAGAGPPAGGPPGSGPGGPSSPGGSGPRADAPWRPTEVPTEPPGGLGASGPITAEVPEVVLRRIDVDDAPPPSEVRSARRQVWFASAFVVLVLLVVGVVILLQPDGDREVDTAAGTRSTTPPTETTVPTTPATLGTTPGDAPPVTDAPVVTTPPPTRVDPTPATTATTTPPAPVPTIDRFDATPTATPCPIGRAVGYEWALSWETTDAETAAVGPSGGAAESAPVDGSSTICAPESTAFTLTADGPGGTATATAGGGTVPTTTAPPTTTTPTTIIG